MEEDPFRFQRGDDPRGYPYRTVSQAVGVDRLDPPDETYYRHLPEEERRRMQLIEHEFYSDILRGREYENGLPILDWLHNSLGEREMDYIIRGDWRYGDDWRYETAGGQWGDVDHDLGGREDAIRRLRDYISRLPSNNWIRRMIEGRIQRYQRGASIRRQLDERALSMPWSRANAGSFTRFQFGRETGAVRFRAPRDFRRDYRSDRWRRF